MRITSTGNVGIGTSNPASNKLAIVVANSGSNQSGLDITNAANASFNVSLRTNITELIAGGTGNMLFSNGGGERMRITSGGELYWAATGTAGSDITNGAFLLRDNAGEKYIQLASGVSADSILIYFYKKNGSGVTNTGSISTSGNSTAYNTTSDYRIKEDLKQINGLEKVSAIKVYDFKFKGIDNRMDGVIAHELAEVLPYAVSGQKDAVDENGEIKAQGVDYSKLVPIMIKAIQELKAEIDELKNK
jgi:hypothetical protein